MPESGSQRPAERRGPIFIMGAMGSGTTLLRLMLDSHERIAIPVKQSANIPGFLEVPPT